MIIRDGPVDLSLVSWLLLAWALPVVAAGSRRANTSTANSRRRSLNTNRAVSQKLPMELESLVREVPASFEVHELLGLVYSAQSQDAKASPHLQKAVRLKPDSVVRPNQSGGQPDAPGKGGTGWSGIPQGG